MEIRESSVYKRWIRNLRDERARYRVNARIERLKQGNPGDVKPVGEGVSEMRINYGPGYRVYYKTTTGCQDTGKEIIILLCGGDKATQDEDIKQAKKIAAVFNPDEEE
ncbi:MAG: type II toxin-antitoxin system RelE/ParE family toxin [Treponema sp.]|jgi:putative addiction module killer protein|nr:type II toxin-antitoxin system RelE/ParE family toxin [Treponema sp.]